MLQRRIVPTGRECLHTTCGNTCHRPQEARRERKPIPTYKDKPRSKKTDINAWFLDRAKEMTGKCINCGGNSCARSGSFWKWSIAHILPKNIFESCSTHPDNWLELCIECHTFFDRSLSVAHTMKCWPIAVKKFKAFEASITERHKHLELFRELA